MLNNWVGWHCCVDSIVPEAIHNPVAIMLLVSGLLAYMLCMLF